MANESNREFRTHAGIPVEELYTAANLERLDFDADRELGLPGQPPFTRGVQKNMYRGRLWTMRQYAGFGTAAESNQRYRYLLAQGQSGLSVAFDLPTQMGRDSDHPLARGEVGKVGVAIDSLEDMEVLLAELPLDRITTSMTINATAATLLALYIAVADRRGVSRDKLGGTIQNDILKEYIARGTYIYPPRPSMKLITDVFEYCRAEVPRWNTISISGYHIREAGSDAVQEVAFTLADAIAYVQGAVDRGLKVDEFAPRLAFFFNAHNNFLEEVAKYRAARRMWARIMKDRFGAKDPRSMALRFHTQTAGATLQAAQPLVNIVRVTIQAMAAVLGGTQSLHTNAFDEALALPTEESALLALRTQQVIAHESGVADFVDALAGSYAVETLTQEIERRANEYLGQIDQMGGMVAALEGGFPQRQIEKRAYEHQRAVERKERIVVGVNEYTVAREESRPLSRVSPAVEAEQVAKLQAARSRRDQGNARRALDALATAAREDTNLVPPILQAVKSACTVGEIADALRAVYGEYRQPSTL
ncbi:MAG: methylmalonyl-CoA mutase family protein [Pseudomonadota bacterium]